MKSEKSRIAFVLSNVEELQFLWKGVHLVAIERNTAYLPAYLYFC